MSRVDGIGGIQSGRSESTEEGVSTVTVPSPGDRSDSRRLTLHSLNRIGNLLVPNSNYCAFEDWVVPILDQLVAEQDGPEGERWSPSKIINRLGKEINNEESVYYWCWKVGASVLDGPVG